MAPEEWEFFERLDHIEQTVQPTAAEAYALAQYTLELVFNQQCRNLNEKGNHNYRKARDIVMKPLKGSSFSEGSLINIEQQLTELCELWESYQAE